MSTVAIDAAAVPRGGRPLEADASDEAPNARPIAAEREAQKLVRPYQGMAAWPTVALAAAIVAGFAGVCWLAVAGAIPLWLGLIVNTGILYASQTPLHEACHGNIAGRESRWMWLNHLIGYACGSILLHDYKAFRALHLMHHRDTNDEEFDPDHWVKVRNPLLALWRCLTIVPYYNHYFFKMVVGRPEVPGNKKVAMQVIASYWILYTVAFWLSVYGYWREVLALWIGPHILASALIIYFFAYLTHQPHQDTVRYRDTNIFWFKGRLLGPVVNWLYLFQNYHLIHHLFPRVPFYLYGDAFKELKPVLEREGAHIYEIGR